MHDSAVEVERRVERLLAQLLRPSVVAEFVPCELAAFVVPGEPVAVEDALHATYAPIAAGDAWGPPWSTMWLRCRVTVPAQWAPSSVELRIDLGFDASSPGFQAEGLVFDRDGVVLKGIAPRNAYVPLATTGVKGGDELVVYVEAAANPTIGVAADYAPTDAGRLASAGSLPGRLLGAVGLARCEEEVRELVADVEVLLGLARELAPTDVRRATIFAALSRCADRVDADGVAASAGAARGELAAVLASPAVPSAHTVVATGHAHIDSAWLWPIRETVRKCARTFANVLALMDDDPDLVFSCSQAQQYAWMRDRYPGLYARIKARVAEGRWIPVGGTWVEPDGNLCGGEALVRQLVYGRRFAEEFAIECVEVWLPDSFGYSAAWPQLAKLAGARYFLTQKLSWNQTNRFPHSTFLWEGIDGSRIFTHFPPVATYNSELTPTELARASRDFAEHGRSGCSLVPFGYGDGGGGPTREMLGRARRQADLEGSPRVELGAPATFFDRAEAEYLDPPVWSGELYLEIHRGTFTSQAGIKRGNRRCEHLLREAECWSAAALIVADAAYPYDELRALWERLLLLQFHDILPGSSIGWVNDEAIVEYAAIEAELDVLITAAIAAYVGDGELPMVLNAGPFALEGVPALGVAEPGGTVSGPAVRAEQSGGRIVLDNGLITVEIDADGSVRSIVDRIAQRELVAPGGRANLLQLHRDQPNAWDAWDVDAFYRNTVEECLDLETIACEATPEEAVVTVHRRFHGSTVIQRCTLRRGARRLEFDTDVEWHEHERFLKLAFPLDLRASYASAEIQFGHIDRPLAVNTSWDAARFEWYAHRFVHVGEAGYGVAVANDATYGHDVTRSTRADGGTTTTVRLSLVRGPRFPDPAADTGRHRFSCVVAPGATLADAVALGYAVNLPVRAARGARLRPPLLSVDDGGTGAVVVEAVKVADDRSGDLVVRCYESLGGRARARLVPAFAFEFAELTDLLERPLEGAGAGDGDERGGVTIALRPFEVVTVVFRRAARPVTDER